MTAVNHALTGALIGLLVGQPEVAVPVAIGSHFVCDALPHYDSSLKGARVNSPRFKAYLSVDAALCLLLVAVLAWLKPEHWLLAAFCAFFATSPDLLWINRYRAALKHKPWRPNKFLRFADSIQWFAKPVGAVFEIAWFIAGMVLLVPFLR